VRIWTRSLIGVVPVFLVLSVAVSLLVSVLVPREVAWGYREEVKGLTVSIAAFVDPEKLRDLKQGALHDDERRSLLSPIEKVLETSRARRLLFLHPKSGKPFWVLKATGLQTEIRPLSLELISALETGTEFVTEIVSSESSDVWIRGITTIVDENGATLSLLSVEVDAPLMTTTAEQLRTLYLSGSAGTIAIGFVCALLIAAVLRRNIHRLTAGAQGIALGQTEEQFTTPRGHIQEFQDLWNTIETMACVMQGAITKSRLRLMSTERFLSADQLLEILKEKRYENRCLKSDGIEMSICEIGGGSPSGFLELFATPQGAVCVLGEMQHREADFESGLAASAAVRYLELLMRSPDDPKAAIEKAAALFSFENLIAVVWTSKAKQLEILSADPAVDCKEIVLDTAAAVSLSTLEQRGQERIDLYMNAFGREGAATDHTRAIKQILERVHPPIKGALVVCRRVD
jgi:HAMP domain-containing protein